MLNFRIRAQIGQLAVIAILCATACATRVVAGPAIGQFEMKGLDAEVGEVEFQSQNAWSFGQPSRRYNAGAPGKVVYDDNSVTRQRHALEIEMTPNSFMRMRVGIEYEKERLEDPDQPAVADAFGSLELSEVAMEGVVILRPIPEGGGFGFGMLSEFEHPLEPGELNSILFGPIIGARQGAWSALVNILFIKHFGSGEHGEDGVERDDKWDLGYAAQVKYELTHNWALALEGYGTFDRISNSGRPGEGATLFGDHDQHRAGPVVYHEWRIEGPRAADASSISRVAGINVGDAKAGERGDDEEEGMLMRLGTGILFGLNDNTPAATLKLSLEVEF